MSERGNRKLKFIDRWIGPLILMAGEALFLKRKTQFSLETLSSVALIKTAAIGDTQLLSAIISDLKVFRPDLKVTLFVGSSNHEFAKLLSGVDELVLLPLSNPLKCLSIIRKEKFDLVVDADSWPRISAIFAGFSRAGARIGFKTPGQNRHYLFDGLVDHRSDIHEIENYRNLIRRVGIEAKAPPQDLGTPWVGGSKTAIFHMWPGGTKSYLKEMSAEKWLAIARQLFGRGVNEIVLTGGPADKERVAEFLLDMSLELRPRFINRAGVSFKETLESLRTARIMISVNTGLMHVGAAMGVPVVGLHGPTNPHRWGPVGPHVQAVLSKHQNAGTLNLGFEYLDEENLMDHIQIEDVVGACDALLKTAAKK